MNAEEYIKHTKVIEQWGVAVPIVDCTVVRRVLVLTDNPCQRPAAEWQWVSVPLRPAKESK